MIINKKVRKILNLGRFKQNLQVNLNVNWESQLLVCRNFYSKMFSQKLSNSN